MPKTEINYSKTIIYKIYCYDNTVTDAYVGYTTNFVQKKHNHKQSCTNISSANYHSDLYNMIRKNGGWSNWKMEIIDVINCCDHNDVINKTMDYINKLNTNLTTKFHADFTIPTPKSVINKKKHLQKSQNNNSDKNDDNFYCDKCDYVTSRLCNFNKHCATLKHSATLVTFGDVLGHFSDVLVTKVAKSSKPYMCTICSKSYNSRNGLWVHKKKCSGAPPENVIANNCSDVDANTNILTNAIVTLINQNNELRNMVLEQNKQTQQTQQTLTDVSKMITSELMNAVKIGQLYNINNVNNVNTMINSHNTNTFNLQLFLNETCKDALNIDEFINNIKVTNADLEETARLGYSGGISRIFLNELNALDITKKPIHCSDAKRETIYIKENNVWEKDDEYKTRLIKAVKLAARKNYMQIFAWEKDYPLCKKDPDSKMGKLYNKIIINSMSGGSDAEQIDNVNKIVKIIIRGSIIDKQILKNNYTSNL